MEICVCGAVSPHGKYTSDFICDHCEDSFKNKFPAEHDYDRSMLSFHNIYRRPEKWLIKLLLDIYNITGHHIICMDIPSHKKKKIFSIHMNNCLVIKEYFSCSQLILTNRVKIKYFLDCFNNPDIRIRSATKKDHSKMLNTKDLNIKDMIRENINSGGVYFLESPSFIKIGMSKRSIKNRIYDQTLCPDINLLFWYNAKKPESEEKKLHKRFKEYRSSPHGEWFYKKGDLLCFVEKFKGAFDG
jgi:hypothetical protein